MTNQIAGLSVRGARFENLMPHGLGRAIETPAHVAAFLLEHFGSDVANVRRLGEGEWSTAYAYERSGQEYVVRFGSYVEDFEKDRLAWRHRELHLPIPRVFETGRTPDGYFAISERVHGRGLDTINEAQMRAVLPGVLATLDAIADADISGTTGFGTWGPAGSGPRATWQEALLEVGNDRPGYRTHGWRERLSASAVGIRPFETAFKQMKKLVVDCPEERRLVHGDLLNNNVLVDDKGVAAVLDWGSAKYGDPLYDACWLSFWWPWYPRWQSIDIDRVLTDHFAPKQLERLDQRLQCYRLHIGLDGMAYEAFVGHWDELAWTAERTLAITEGRG